MDLIQIKMNAALLKNCCSYSSSLVRRRKDVAMASSRRILHADPNRHRIRRMSSTCIMNNRAMQLSATVSRRSHCYTMDTSIYPAQQFMNYHHDFTARAMQNLNTRNWRSFSNITKDNDENDEPEKESAWSEYE